MTYKPIPAECSKCPLILWTGSGKDMALGLDFHGQVELHSADEEDSNPETQNELRFKGGRTPMNGEVWRDGQGALAAKIRS